MEKMFSKKAWCNPIATASSTGVSIKNVNIKSSRIEPKLLSSNDDSVDDIENNRPEQSKLS